MGVCACVHQIIFICAAAWKGSRFVFLTVDIGLGFHDKKYLHYCFFCYMAQQQKQD